MDEFFKKLVILERDGQDPSRPNKACVWGNESHHHRHGSRKLSDSPFSKPATPDMKWAGVIMQRW